MNGNELIASGLLELYVMGMAGPEECRMVERMAELNPEVKKSLDRINDSIMFEAMEQAVEPPALVKPFLMAVVNYMERVKNGEAIRTVPILNEKSTADDFAEWLNDPQAVYEGKENIHARIINLGEKEVSAIVWLSSYVPHEVHHDQRERLLVLEGSCEFIVEDKVYPLSAGDYFEVPLHKDHHAKVTSKIPCKIILQRIAA